MAMMLAAFSFSGCSTFSIHILVDNKAQAASTSKDMQADAVTAPNHSQHTVKYGEIERPP
jgi:hypothetical protein